MSGCVRSVRFRQAGLAFCLAWHSMPVLAAAADVSLSTPPHGSVLTANTVDLEGTYSPPERTRVFLYVGNQAHTGVSASEGRWKATRVFLTPGHSVVSVGLPDLPGGGVKGRFVLTRANVAGALPRGTQTILLEPWSPRAAEVLGGVVARTVLSAPAAEAGAVPARIRRRVVEITSQYLSAFDFEIVETSDGRPHHLVRFVPRFVDRVYGYTPEPDCGNPTKNGESEVYLGTLAHRFMSDSTWAPAALSDTLDQRMEDLAFAIAHTTLHEILHGVGLVACDWMPPNPEDLYHNRHNPELDGDGVWMFGWGRSMLDPARFMNGTARIGEWNPHRRGPRAVVPLSPFDRGYLSLLQGKP